MASSVVSRTLSYRQGGELLLKLEQAGLTPELAQKVVENAGNILAAMIVSLIVVGPEEEDFQALIAGLVARRRLNSPIERKRPKLYPSVESYRKKEGIYS